jgi:hypothetical protein
VRKPISTATHGVLDFLTAGTFMYLPSILGFSKPLTRAMRVLGVTKMTYALLTRHELGIVKAIPMKAHLALDCVGGATLCALPFVLGEDDETAVATCVALGAFDIIAAPLTETHPRPDSVLPDVGQKVRLAAKQATAAVGQGAGST